MKLLLQLFFGGTLKTSTDTMGSYGPLELEAVDATFLVLSICQKDGLPADADTWKVAEDALLAVSAGRELSTIK